MAPDLEIVICDGSDYDFSEVAQWCWPDASIEVLFFRNDRERVATLGKGYGEGEIIAHAMEHSRTLSKYQGFMKCTSKYWISNFREVSGSQNPTQFHIRRKQDDSGDFRPHWVDTRFFIVEKDFYESYLGNAYQEVAIDERRYIEHVYARRIFALGALGKLEFPVKPKICGVSGTTGVRHG